MREGIRCRTQHARCQQVCVTPDARGGGRERTIWINVSAAQESWDEEDVRYVRALLLEAMTSVQECLERGGNVLVHCLNGWHRTGFFVLGTQALNNVLVLIIHGGVAIYSSNNYVVAKKLSLVVVIAMYRHTCTVARHSL